MTLLSWKCSCGKVFYDQILFFECRESHKSISQEENKTK
jgi:hypothetical protein